MILWGEHKSYVEEPFERESDLENAISEATDSLFGSKRIYLEIKRKIGAKGKTKNIPDGYLIDLTSVRDPKLFVVENELAKHEPLKHIAVQILEFSLSFETSSHLLKSILKEALVAEPKALKRCETYIVENGFENIDVLLERMVYGEDKFNALVIIDELAEELETVLISRFQFPVEILTLKRYRDSDGNRLYQFEPFLEDVISNDRGRTSLLGLPVLDPSEIDTIVVSAHKDGFEEVFLGEKRWYSIRIHNSMISKIKHIAVYQVAPQSAITHIAPVANIEQWKNTSKYVVNFASPSEPIGPINLVKKGAVKAPQGPRYTSKVRLESAETLEEAF